MKRIVFISIALLLIVPVYSSVYKGQKEYMKKCKKCHHNGGDFAKKKTMQEWKNVFSDKSLLVQLHKNEKDALDYFNSKRFEKKKKHLLDFFKKYASDSGNIPACSD